MGVEFDNVDVKTAGDLGLPVCNIPDYGTEEVADHAMALILGMYRGIFSATDHIRKGKEIRGKLG